MEALNHKICKERGSYILAGYFTTTLTDAVRTRSGGRKLIPYLPLLISLPLLLIRLDVYPSPWYDEGYSIQVSHALIEMGLYGTYNATEGYRPFDMTISSGPTIILPVAVNFELFGLGMLQARIVVALYALLAVYAAYNCALFMFGERAALLSTLLLFVPGISIFRSVAFFVLSRQVLGEVPSLALVLLGLWLWFRSWETGSWLLSIAAGIALGLGIISKPQVMFALAPGIGLVALIRSIRQPRQTVRYMTPLVLLAAVFLGWTLVQRAGTTDQLRAESTPLMIEAMRLHFFTGLFGRSLTRTGIALTIIMIVTVGLAAWRVRRASGNATANQQWAEITVASIIAFAAVWYALFSVGFERYAFMGLMLSLVLLGKTAFDALVWAASKLSLPQNQVIAGMIAVLSLVVVAANGFVLARQWNTPNDLEQAARFINETIPEDAIVESLEVELNALTNHREYHRANYTYMYEAIRQRNHENRSFDLGYNVLQANPDFLIRGAMSDWLDLYDESVVAMNFRPLAEFGNYRLYQRVRRGSEG